MHPRLLLTLILAGSATAADYTLPQTWAGTKAGDTAGNPALVTGAARWRIDQVWPADPTESQSYVPMIWNGKEWGVKENGFGGQPVASTSSGSVVLGIRGPWDGAAAPRTAALVFIAPAAGKYTVSGVLDVTRWAGDQGIAVHLYRRDAVKHKVRPVAEIPVEIKAGNPLATTATLAVGEELLLIAEIGAFHTAGGVAIRELKISGP